MMTVSIDAVFIALPHLTNDQLQQVVMRCHALITINGGGVQPLPENITIKNKKQDGGSFYESLYISIGEEIKTHTRSGFAPYKIFIKQQNQIYQKFIDAARIALNANQNWFPSQSRAEQASMVKLYAQLLVDHMIDRNLPLVWQMVATVLYDLPVIVEQSFPGYASVGLMSVVQSLRTGPQTGLNRPVLARRGRGKG